MIARPGQRVPTGPPIVRVQGARGVALVRVLVPERRAFGPIDRARRAASCATIPA